MIDGKTLAELYANDNALPGPLQYDGHGMNDEGGQRVLTFAKWPDSEGGGYVHTREARERHARLIAAAPELARENAELREQVAQLLQALGNTTDMLKLYIKAFGFTPAIHTPPNVADVIETVREAEKAKTKGG